MEQSKRNSDTSRVIKTRVYGLEDVHLTHLVIYIFCAFLTLLPISSYAQVKLPIARIDSIFSDLDKPDSPGCSLIILDGEEIVYSRGYGSANLDLGIQINSQTVFNLGSISKQFLAAGILHASLKGHLSLDDDIRKWIPEFLDYGHLITVRHLVHHTSGIRDEAQLRAVGNLPDDLSRTGIIELLCRQQALNFIPGEKWLYSNGGYLLLEEILERATGQGVHQYLYQEFFRPLDLSSAYYGRYRGVVPNASTSYVPKQEIFQRDSHVADVAGIRINSQDMAKWMTSLASDRLGPPGFLELQTRTGILNKGENTHYAFGLDIIEHRGLPIISHGGAGAGYRAGMAIYPDEGVSICAMCNLSNLDAVARIRQVAEILLEDRMDPVDPSSSAEGYTMPWPAPDGEALKVSVSQLQDLAGQYYAPELDVVFLVSAEETGLRVGPAGWMRPMKPTSKPDLFTDGRGWAKITFRRNEDNNITGFTMDIGRVSGLILEKRSN